MENCANGKLLRREIVHCRKLARRKHPAQQLHSLVNLFGDTAQCFVAETM
jgi:hypothetical protein